MEKDLAVGQYWYGMHPGGHSVVEVVIEEITDKTICINELSLLTVQWNGDVLWNKTRYLKGKFTFVEMLPPRPKPKSRSTPEVNDVPQVPVQPETSYSWLEQLKKFASRSNA